VNLTALRDWLRNALQTFGDRDPIIIRPSPDAKHERIIQVLNAISGAGIEDPENPGKKKNFKNLSFS
jgi:biopolymer transport protein ExbD